MRKVIALLATAGLLAAATSAFAATTIVGSKHDLSYAANATGGLTYASSTQICVYCHTPHNAVEANVLWNRANPAGAKFKLYSGVGMVNTSYKSGLTADSTSLFCMSCHDGFTGVGVVAHNVVATRTGEVLTSGTIASSADLTRIAGVSTGSNLGANSVDLSRTHPINFPVSTNDTQADLWPGTGSAMGKASYSMPLFKSARDATRTLECGSCHAVHDSANQPFLRYTMAGSLLCLGCHNK
jgi:predicted CXXCH cytochrome family protein